MAERVMVYIDGFNLYFGLKDSGWRQLYWLDMDKFAKSFVKTGQTLIRTKYFTARISGPEDKVKRQRTFLDAVKTLYSVDMIYGAYRDEPVDCPKCGGEITFPNEKKTDVNIAVTMIMDAIDDYFDVAILVSGDSDLVPVITRLRKLTPTKRYIVAFPPNRVSEELKKICHGHRHIDKVTLARCQFPESLKSKDGGFMLHRPLEWRGVSIT